jgi:hypothetical protein
VSNDIIIIIIITGLAQQPTSPANRRSGDDDVQE